MNRSHKMFMVHSCVLCLVFAVMLGFDQIAAHSATWQAGPPLNTGRNQFAGGVIDDKIFVFGGNTNSGPDLKSTEMLDPATEKWVYKADNEHNFGWGIEEVSGAVVNGRFYVFGAYGGVTPYGLINFVEEYNPATNIWTSKAPMPTTRSGSIAVSYNNKIYVFGGGHEHKDYDVVEAYDPAKNTWETVTNIPKTQWDGYAVAVVGDNAYLIGGNNTSTRQILNDVYAYDFVTGTWTTSGFAKPPNPKVYNTRGAAPVVNGKIYMIGGGEGTYVPDNNGVGGDARLSSTVDIYDTLSNTWQTGVPLTTPTAGFSTFANNKIYVVGGDNIDGEMTTAAWSFDLNTSSDCTATINENLSLHIPYLSYGNGILSLWTDFAYEFNPTYPTLIPFKLTNFGIITSPSFSCAASTLSDDFKIHIPDILLPGGSTHIWVDLEYSQALSIGGNFYWVVSNYGIL